ncbi:MAG TPA: lysyl oxidase family protein [Pyrinomonadaceae bacterium]|nr:lysyl oxidase family protein [Pyrinomonadaceae bacterium]
MPLFFTVPPTHKPLEVSPLKKLFLISLLVLGCACALALFPQVKGRSAAHSTKAKPAVAVPAVAGLPDLIVDQATLRQHWVVRVEDLPAEFCSVEEGGITPGTHTLLRFTVGTPNIGTADLFVGDPNQHVDDGLFEFASCHNHYHFRHYATYELVDPANGFVWRAAKRGFCMIDIEKYQGYTGDRDNQPHYRNCGAINIPGNQGISKGWSDVYEWKLGGQYFVLDGGDGQPVVPPGQYIIRVTVNPGFVPKGTEPCRFADPLHKGVCHQLPESDFENNVSQITITIPEKATRQGVGPLKNQVAITTEPIDQ